MKRNIIIGCIAFIVLVMSGCSDWLSVQPSDRQTEDQLFSTKGGFYAALNGIYTKLNDNNLYGKELSYGAIEVMARRYSVSSKNKTYSALTTWSYTSDEVVPTIAAIYETAYSVILNCNIFLKNLDLRKDVVGSKDYEMLKGEVLAVRAFVHFDLLRLFGPIYSVDPDAKAIAYTTSAVGATSDILPASVVLNDYILKDLAAAEELLLGSDPVVTEGALAPKEIEDEKFIYSEDNSQLYRQLRFNYYAVLTLKARVQLYKGDKVAALATAKSTISALEANNFFPFVDPNTLLGNTINPDMMFSSEILFGSYRKSRGEIYDNTFNPEKAGDNLLQPRAGFVFNTLLATGDYRRSQWGTSGSSSNTAPVLAKYKDLNNPLLFYATITPLLRVSELYLIAAESEPNVADGCAYLDKLKVHRGEVVTPVPTIEVLHTQLLNEYCREFYGEGQMFFYCKRRNVSLPAANNGHGNSTLGFANRADRLVLSLPSSETDYR